MDECDASELAPEPSEIPLACTYYINGCFSLPTVPGASHEDNPRPLPMRRLQDALLQRQSQLHGYWWLKTTPGGLLLSFSRLDDAEDFFRSVDIASVLEGPVQVAQLPLHLPYEQHWCEVYPTPYLLIRDVPWSVPLADVRVALQEQQILVAGLERHRQHIRIQVLSSMQSEWLLADGFDFYGVARFAVSCVYHEHPAPVSETDVIQCYRCQGFGHIAPHCRQVPRCVRCGGPHHVDFCSRSRDQLVCCNCSAAHHAAFKHCPVRLRMSRSIPVHFTLSVTRPTQSTAPISTDLRATGPRCLL